MGIGEQNKQEGMALVLDNENEQWKSRYLQLVPSFLKTNPVFIGEDVRTFMLENNIGHPHHENTWGAMFNSAVARSDYVIRTGKVRNAKSGKSNAHAFREWRSLIAMTEAELVPLNQRLNELAFNVKIRKMEVREALKLAAQYGAESVF